MTKSLKKHAFLLPFARLLTHSEGDAYDAIPFREAESYGDETVPALTAPTLWGDQAVEVMAEGAAFNAVPVHVAAIEENTVPSWLWRHRAKGAARQSEGDLRAIFDRVVGSAAVVGWKQKLFSSEKHARSFYDEARCALMQRHIAFEPVVMKNWGVEWAYGVKAEAVKETRAALTKSQISLSNAELDAEWRAAPTSARASWKKNLAVTGKSVSRVHLHLSDITADWQADAGQPARAALDVLSLRHNDGSVNIEALRHMTRLAMLLIDLHDADITLGLANVSVLLMALGLAYDSEAGRALAASLAAVVSAECIATSAELAALRGASQKFMDHRERVMRRLRNHCRAAHGDRNDYEHVSVVPAALVLKNCPDLALAAAAQQRWDDAVVMAQHFGLRAIVVTDLTPSPLLAMLMQSASQGMQPMHSLTVMTADESGIIRAELHPAVGEALQRLSYPRNTARVIIQHIAGTHSLNKTPLIHSRRLRACGFTEEVCAKIEAYIPQVSSLRLAITPWIVGGDFCRQTLNISARLLASPRLDLLTHLGFTDDDIAAADAVCYGHGTVRNAKALHLRHRPVFAHGREIGADALTRMAAAVQPFVTGDAGLVLTFPVADSTAKGTEMALAAWRLGIKSLVLCFDPAVSAPIVRPVRSNARRIKAAPHAYDKPVATTGRLAVLRSKKSTPISLSRKQNDRHGKNI